MRSSYFLPPDVGVATDGWAPGVLSVCRAGELFPDGLTVEARSEREALYLVRLRISHVLHVPYKSVRVGGITRG